MTPMIPPQSDEAGPASTILTKCLGIRSGRWHITIPISSQYRRLLNRKDRPHRSASAARKGLTSNSQLELRRFAVNRVGHLCGRLQPRYPGTSLDTPITQGLWVQPSLQQWLDRSGSGGTHFSTALSDFIPWIRPLRITHHPICVDHFKPIPPRQGYLQICGHL